MGAKGWSSTLVARQVSDTPAAHGRPGARAMPGPWLTPPYAGLGTRQPGEVS